MKFYDNDQNKETLGELGQFVSRYYFLMLVKMASKFRFSLHFGIHERIVSADEMRDLMIDMYQIVSNHKTTA